MSAVSSPRFRPARLVEEPQEVDLLGRERHDTRCRLGEAEARADHAYSNRVMAEERSAKVQMEVELQRSAADVMEATEHGRAVEESLGAAESSLRRLDARRT